MHWKENLWSDSFICQDYFVPVIQVRFSYLERHSEIFCPFSKERQGEGRRMFEYMGRKRTAVKLWELGGGSRIELAFDRKDRDTSRYWWGLGIAEEIDKQLFSSTWNWNCLMLQLKCLAEKLGLDIPSLLHVDKQEWGKKDGQLSNEYQLGISGATQGKQVWDKKIPGEGKETGLGKRELQNSVLRGIGNYQASSCYFGRKMYYFWLFWFT